MSDTDPWAVLGLSPDASVDEARAARRRLAKVLHPDLHAGEPASARAELAARMTEVNGALAQIEAAAEAVAATPSAAAAAARAHAGADRERAPGSPRAGTRSGSGARRGRGPAGRAGAGREAPSDSGSPAAGVADSPAPAGGGGESGYSASATGPADPDTFSVGCLPVEAFEALFVVAYGLGDILVADEPYLLELYLTEPCPCFCRLSLVPEAGASLVTVEVTPAAETTSAPSPAAVIEVLVAELNALVTS